MVTSIHPDHHARIQSINTLEFQVTTIEIDRDGLGRIRKEDSSRIVVSDELVKEPCARVVHCENDEHDAEAHTEQHLSSHPNQRQQRFTAVATHNNAPTLEEELRSLLGCRQAG